MKTQLAQIILIACMINHLFVPVEPRNQVTKNIVAGKVKDDGKFRENFQNLFNSLVKHEAKKSEMYRNILKQEVSNEKQAFEKIKNEVWIARKKNSNKKMSFYKENNYHHRNIAATKRETNEKDGNTEDLHTAFADLEKQLEKLIDSQEKHYKQAYERFGEAKNETQYSTTEQLERNNSFASKLNLHDHFTEPEQIEELSDAMVMLQNKAFEMLKNHAKIMGNEANIVEKVKEYEQDVNRVSKQIEKHHGEEVKELLTKKDQLLSEKDVLKNVTVRQKMSKFAEDRLLQNNPFRNTKKETLRDAVARLKSRVEKMMETQLKVLENQSKFATMVEKYSQQLVRGYGRILGKVEDRSPPTKVTLQSPDWVPARKFLDENN